MTKLTKFDLAELCSSARKNANSKTLIKGVLLNRIKTVMYGYIPCSISIKFNPFVTDMAVSYSHGCNNIRLIVFVGDKFMALSDDTQKFIINEMLIDNDVHEGLYGLQSELDCLKEYKRTLSWRDFAKRKEVNKRIKTIA